MTEVLRFAVLGLGLGAIYSLMAQGIVLVHRSSGVVNFAHGAFAMVGAYTWYTLTRAGLPGGLAIPLGCGAAALAGVVVEVAIMRPLRGSSAATRMIATVGVLTAIEGAGTLIFGDSTDFVGSVLPVHTWSIGNVPVETDRVALVAVAVVVTVAAIGITRYTNFGLATTAAAENERVLALCGRSPTIVAAVNWGLGGLLAGLAGILVTPITGLAVGTLALLVLPGLAAALVGRFDSFGLALLGGLAIGVAQSEVTKYVSAPGWDTAVPLLVLIGVLFVRGDAVPGRAGLAERMPAVGGPPTRRWAVLGVVGGGAALAILLPADWTLPLVFSLASAVVALSLVVVTGYAGQLSLGQFALAGVGALIAARISAVSGLPFLVTLAAGVACAIPAAILFALPVMRSRGVSLAIATLGLAVVVEQVVLGNSTYTGGPNGTTVRSPSVFGWSIDPVAHPQRYALAAVAALGMALTVVGNLRRSKVGRQLLAIRGNERAATALGVSIPSTRLYAFATGGAIAAVGGIVLAFSGSFVDFTVFNTDNGLLLVVVTVIGGVGYLSGAVVGGVLMTGGIGAYALGKVLGAAAWLPLLTGVLLTINLIVAPDGAVGRGLQDFERITRRLKRSRKRARYRIDETGQASIPGVGALVVGGLTVRFGAVQALRDFSLEVASGEVVGLIGPNGAGKTTAIEAITGAVRPVSGTISFRGVPLEGRPAYYRARLGIGRSFQGLELFEDLTVLENLLVACDRPTRSSYLADLVFPRRPKLGTGAIAAIDQFNLKNELERMPRELAYGHRRLVAIARALAAEPAVIFLDEPAAGLGLSERKELGALLKRLAAEWRIGIVLVEHDVGLVMSTCDRIVVLNFGEKIAEGTPAEVRNDPEVIAAYLGVDEAQRTNGDSSRMPVR